MTAMEDGAPRHIGLEKIQMALSYVSTTEQILNVQAKVYANVFALVIMDILMMKPAKHVNLQLVPNIRMEIIMRENVINAPLDNFRTKMVSAAQ